MCFSDVTPYTYSEFLVISCKGFLVLRQADKTKVLSPVLAHVQNSLTGREKICFFFYFLCQKFKTALYSLSLGINKFLNTHTNI